MSLSPAESGHPPVPPLTPPCRRQDLPQRARSPRVESLSGGSFPFLIKRLFCRGGSALVSGADFCAVEAGPASWGAHHGSDAAEQKTTNFGGVVLFIWFSLGMSPARGKRRLRGSTGVGYRLHGRAAWSLPPPRIPLRLPTRGVLKKRLKIASKFSRSGPFPQQTSAPHGAAAARRLRGFFFFFFLCFFERDTQPHSHFKVQL